MKIKKAPKTGVHALLADERIRRWTMEDGATVYAAQDIVAVLTDTAHPEEFWADLKVREPYLAHRVIQLEVVPRTVAPDGGFDLSTEPETIDALDVEGVLRLVQSIPSPKAERIKNWLSANARERMEEAEDPELAIVRTRRAYEQQGYSKAWVDKRLRAVSGRHEVASEWYRRGAKESDDFRQLTNELMAGAFGMDVETYRRHKGLRGTTENLRDHMNDLELALTTLAEGTAVALHREHGSRDFAQLLADAKAAGEIVAVTRAEIERRTGRPIVAGARGHRLEGTRSGSQHGRDAGPESHKLPADADSGVKATDVAA